MNCDMYIDCLIIFIINEFNSTKSSIKLTQLYSTKFK